MALKMIYKAGENEEKVLELAETPEIVLLEFCDLIIRKQDLRNPDARNMLDENLNALRNKAEKEPDGNYTPFSRQDLKEYIAQIDDFLKKFDQNGEVVINNASF